MLRILPASGDYGDVFPRLGGMLMSGLGTTVAGIIRARAEVLSGHPAGAELFRRVPDRVVSGGDSLTQL
jgi:hypothetical protein